MLGYAYYPRKVHSTAYLCLYLGMLISTCVFIYNRAWLGYSVHEAQITVYFARFARTLVYAYSAHKAQSILVFYVQGMCRPTVHLKPRVFVVLLCVLLAMSCVQCT